MTPSKPAHVFRDLEWVVTSEFSGATLARALRSLYAGSSWNEVRRLVQTGKVSVNEGRVVDAERRLTSGESIVVRMTAPRQDTAAASLQDRIVFVDTHVVVVNKPAGISTVPYEEGERGTLDELVARTVKRRGKGPEPSLGVVQRLDKPTSGLIVFARTLAAKRHLQQQFREHTVYRRYIALAHGAVAARTFESRLVADRGDGLRGSTDNPKLGRPAVTHVRPIERFASATQIECRLETGRTHQIRIHLSEAGHPLLGETVYIRNYDAPLLPAPRLMLHAAELGFTHPATGNPVRFSEPIPQDMRDVIERLKRESP